MRGGCKLFFLALFVLYLNNVNAARTGRQKIIRVYEENGFFSGEGKGKAYNGNRFDCFYEKKTSSDLFHKLMPETGNNSNLDITAVAVEKKPFFINDVMELKVSSLLRAGLIEDLVLSFTMLRELEKYLLILIDLLRNMVQSQKMEIELDTILLYS